MSALVGGLIDGSGGSPLGPQLSDHARELHTKMLGSVAGVPKMYTQKELQTLLPLVKSLGDLMMIVQELLDHNLIKLVKQNNELKFQAVDASEAAKKTAMSSEESLVYSYIEASGREGIWSKTIKARTNLHQHVVLKCLKSLESQRYVKSVKSVKYPTRKIYMLYNLQPSVEVTGGPWFTEGELDVEFINSLLTIVWRFVAENTFPNGFGDDTTTQSRDVQYVPGHKSYSSTGEILEFISASQVTNVQLRASDIRALCEVLLYDDKLEQTGHDCYRATLQSLNQLSGGVEANEARDPKGTQPALSDCDEFSIFDHYKVVPPVHSDAEAVFFDEWVL
ncbi:DNA-directed RNA polymerase III subunit C34 KNAG_0I00540 [Huiozyma naganishii CBS 8797]|uniref:DNA-directed RNA polymerase III subunit RPC6 n=1 Tax=Huiozyma naganishii (strain ATCC MYA-139 / BCRC 22969 / CBS 8797 / KCTC 17520 / NBRC 10181 / NCYC 3082 / Yp74L-3) TaxID=1071383 RepID=J7RAE2_HUIN7|nr:hypothetical protein KNAG_0I00540 [Kazachstania naganishii CBS 8797]CCK71845.1 hypothetical protein KNAG_0I00540 [Kazachstania naganishii CBS 8797]